MPKALPAGMLPEVLKEDDRPKWDNKFQYILSCIGFAVGLGNVWRFPYLCQIYGGGIASMVVSFVVGLYYNTILCWVLWYFFNSFQDPLPWSTCPLNENRTGLIEECRASTPVNYFWYRRTLNVTTDITESGTTQWWLVLCLAAAWAVVYLCTIRGIETTGKAIYITAFFPYLVLTVFLIRGLTLPGAIDGLVYLFTPNLNILKNPRVWLDAATQIFFSLSLAFGGLIAFASYNPPKNDCEKDAVTVAVVNSITSLYASIPIFSVLGFKATTSYWDCLDRNILSIINAFDLPEQSILRDNYTTWFEYLNSEYPDKIASLKLKRCNLQEFLDQSASGTGLAFIVFTEAIILMPGSQVWAILFFVMLFSLGLSSMFGNIEGVFTPLMELNLIPKSVPKEAISGVICLISFASALCFTLRSGSYWLHVFDSYAGSLPLLIIAFFEVTAVAYVYGIKRFSDNIKWMTGRQPNLYWKVMWKIISPLLMLTVFLAFVSVQVQKQPTYSAWNPEYKDFPAKEEKLYPGWVVAICALLAALPSICIPAVALYHLIKRVVGRQKSSMDSSL
ncbi:PREDICTED: sodium-dependent neutral amino acid transporter B(0)AT3-like isoform X2 [Gavialis gangeticus]|uniref:sodium-dependent neutral amino acid transporter B(0)AT3-like isoform X2 n=1 Tax=Gavialis gangeticus TaxID=94835 RepID=UPI00092F5DAE|nr:PREDICTED: sodium-dependent neutral amino acid transporter B(0)AT3-like isoform X2 [Gavialis gangeticus]